LLKGARGYLPYEKLRNSSEGIARQDLRITHIIYFSEGCQYTQILFQRVMNALWSNYLRVLDDLWRSY
jgi:hypothetical protein